MPKSEKRIDWNTIRAEYIAGASYGRLSKAYGLAKSTIFKRSKSEKWDEKKKRTADAVETRVIEKTADEAASNAVKLEKLRGRLIDKLARAVDLMPDGAGTYRREQEDRPDGKTITDFRLLDLVDALDKLSRGTAGDTGGGEVLDSILDVLSRRRDEHD